MLGLIIKDYFETYCIKKNLISNVFGYICLVLILVIMPDRYTYILACALIMPMISATVCECPITQDDISKFDEMLLTYPISKKQIILSKYYSMFLSILIHYAFMFVFTYLYSFVFQVMPFQEAVIILLFSIIYALFMQGISIVGYIWLGGKKGSILFLGLVVLLTLGFLFIHINFDVVRIVDSVLSMELWLQFILSLAISVFTLVVSYYISLWIYSKRYS